LAIILAMLDKLILLLYHGESIAVFVDRECCWSRRLAFCFARESVVPVFISKVVLDKLISLLYHSASVAVFVDRECCWG
jgi:hypothetical protein